MTTRAIRCIFVIALLGATAVAPRATASNAWLDMQLDPFGPGTWALYAETSFGDNGGIAGYNIPLLDVSTVIHRSPWIQIASPNFRPAGFTHLRSNDNVFTLTAFQDQSPPASLPNLSYGFGQTSDSFAAHGLSPAFGSPHVNYEQLSWDARLLLAEGTYDPGQLPDVRLDSEDLTIAVFDSSSGSTWHEAEIIDLDIHSPLLDAEITVVGGDYATYQFTPPFEPNPFDTVWNIRSFIGPGKNHDPHIGYNDNFEIGGFFEWDTTGSALGTYQALIQFGDVYSGSVQYYGTLTIHLVPEPANAVLLSLSAVGLMGAFRRRARG